MDRGLFFTLLPGTLWLAFLLAAFAAIGQNRGAAPQLAVTTHPPALTIFAADGKKLVVVDMKTGKAKLNGDPNEAARLFWDAVAHAGMARCTP